MRDLGAHYVANADITANPPTTLAGGSRRQVQLRTRHALVPLYIRGRWAFTYWSNQLSISNSVCPTLSRAE